MRFQECDILNLL